MSIAPNGDKRGGIQRNLLQLLVCCMFSLPIVIVAWLSTSFFLSLPVSDTSGRTTVATISVALVVFLLKACWNAITSPPQEINRSVSLTSIRHRTQKGAFQEVDVLIAREIANVRDTYNNAIIVSQSHHVRRSGLGYVVTASLLVTLRE